MKYEGFAVNAVRERVLETLPKTESSSYYRFDVYVVWACHTLGNEKYLIATDLPDGRYYEVTFNTKKDEAYLDEYVKVHNEVI